MWLTRNTPKKKKKIAERTTDHLSLLALNSRFKGDIRFEGTARIDGRLEGDISSTGMLLIGEKAVIEGNISASSVVCYGTITGDIIAGEKVELRVPAVLVGRVKTPCLSLEEGVSFLGASEVQGNGVGVSKDSKLNSVRHEPVTVAPGLARSLDLRTSTKRLSPWTLPSPSSLTGEVAI